MSLSPEDQLRLNVLLAHELLAVRIDEVSMCVLALSADGEACVPLSPDCRPGQYLKRLREMLSTHALGSPGGYPVFLQRWTRMGQHREGQLDKLLLLGEPEAVVAVAGAPGLTPELARRVWWLMPEADIARRLLEHESVANSGIGHEIANYLVEHLAFEEDPMTAITSIRRVLQPGLITDAVRQRIWSRAQHRHLYYKLGFLEAIPDDLPGTAGAREMAEASRLAEFARQGNPLAQLLVRVWSAGGQRYLTTVDELLRHPTDKFTTAVLFDNLGRFFSGIRHLAMANDLPADERLAAPRQYPLPAVADILDLLEAIPSIQCEVETSLALSRVDESLAFPVISKTSASGTLLRRKLEPVTRPIHSAIAVLCTGPAAGRFD